MEMVKMTNEDEFEKLKNNLSKRGGGEYGGVDLMDICEEINISKPLIKAQILKEALPLHDKWMREQFADVREKALRKNPLSGLSENEKTDIAIHEYSSESGIPQQYHSNVRWVVYTLIEERRKQLSKNKEVKNHE